MRMLQQYQAAEVLCERASVAILRAQLSGAAEADVQRLRKAYDDAVLVAVSLGDQVHAERLTDEAAQRRFE